MTDRFEPVRVLLRQACGQVFSGCSVAVAVGGAPVFVETFGDLGTGPFAGRSATSDTLYDVASLTKALATAPIAMSLVGLGRLDLADPVARWLPGVDRRITVRHLLEHTAGLPAWRPYFLELLQDGRTLFAPTQARARVLSRLRAEPLTTAPGEREVYSDLGFLLLGWVLEAAGEASLDRLFAERVAGPLGLSARFGPLPDATNVAPTEAYAGRPLAVGVVHDDNAFALGGIEGHAGLFATARDAATIGVELLVARRGYPTDGHAGDGHAADGHAADGHATDGHAGDGHAADGHAADGHAADGHAEGMARHAPTHRLGAFDPGVVRAFVDAPRPALPRTRILGFDTPTPGASSAGATFGREAFGHLGFTGCSWWCDPRRDLVVTLLSNRVHPSRANEAIRALRPRFHDAIAAALEA